jgi:hypothetical protein
MSAAWRSLHLLALGKALAVHGGFRLAGRDAFSGTVSAHPQHCTIVTYCTAKLSDVGNTGVEKRTCECYAVVKRIRPAASREISDVTEPLPI